MPSLAPPPPSSSNSEACGWDNSGWGNVPPPATWSPVAPWTDGASSARWSSPVPRRERVRGLTTEAQVNDRLVAVEDEISALRSAMNAATNSINSLDDYIRTLNLSPSTTSSSSNDRFQRLATGVSHRLASFRSEVDNLLCYMAAGTLSPSDLQNLMRAIIAAQGFVENMVRGDGSRPGSPK